jgi:2-polyprenyl-3-methyl-5-hydroxy-6-metoxy-1,4-benzoquinol methylase/uncharacterized coiled-coil protein SlyX
MSLKYTTQPNLGDRNNSHALTVELVGRDKSVLEVGTSTGYVSKVLVANGCRVVGIELDPAAARGAEEFCDRVVVGDVESLDLEGELGDETFDVVLLGDVLEHLKDPRKALERVRPFLKPGGYVVASIPNVAHGSVRLALMQGRFRYRSLGLLDDTHLRFFTRESVEELFDEAGFSVSELERTRVGVFDTEIEVDREAVPKEALRSVLADPEAETYQFVLQAFPSGAVGGVSGLAAENRSLREQVAWRDGVIHDLHRRLRNLEELQRRLEDRELRLAANEEAIAKLKEKLVERNRELAQRQRTVNQLTNRLNRR